MSSKITSGLNLIAFSMPCSPFFARTILTFDLKKVSEVGVADAFEVELNDGALKSKVFDFVKAYNDMADIMKNLGGYNPDTKEAGQLQGDPGLRSIQAQIRKIMTSSIEGSGLAFSSLSSIGITTNKEGVLVNDLSKLDEVIKGDINSLSSFFSSEGGLSEKLDTALKGYLATDGLLTTREEGIQSRIKDIAVDRENLSRRLLSIESRYRKQFGAMDALVAQLNSISTFLAQQLENLPGPRILKSK